MRHLLAVIVLLGLAASWAAAQDPVKVSPQYIKVEFENDQVRVLRAKRGPHTKVPMHEHPAYVTVYLTDVDQKITNADGTVQEIHRKAGETSLSKPLKHAEENISDRPLEVVVIELKPGSARGSFSQIKLDPVKLDPKYHTVDSENERVRVLRTVLAPHIKSPMHEHPSYVVVYLTDLHTKMAMADGTVVDNRRKAGDVAWRDALKHSTENVEDLRGEEIQVELK